MDIVSIYQKIKGTKERLDIQEAYNIYNLLRARYVSTQTVQLFTNFVHDVDWEIILERFKKHFNMQIDVLEKLDPETITDKFMYRNILSWELTSLDTHVRAIIETIRNDSLRKLWSGILNTELEYYDKYLKYGKMKGWTRIVPIYGEPVT